MRRIFGRLLIIVLLVAVFFNAAIGVSGKDKDEPRQKNGKVLVIYSGQKSGQGYYDAHKIKLYLRHFKKGVDLISSSDYSPGKINSYTWIFYSGSTEETISTNLTRELTQTSKTVVWINNNFEQLSKPFYDGIGFKPLNKKVDAKYIRYKKVDLPKNDKSINLINVTEKKKNTVYGQAIVRKGRKSPYILNSKNFWYVSDNPFYEARESSSYLVFIDILHEVIENHPQSRKASFQIEGVTPKSNPEKLQTLVDFMYFNHITFSISLTPVYKKSNSTKAVYLSEKKELIKVIKDAQKKGGVLVLNGYNTRVDPKTGRNLVPKITKKPGGSKNKRLAEGRVKQVIDEIKKSKLEVKIWQMPKWASTDDYAMYTKYFKYFYERTTEPPPPFLTGDNAYGQKIIPENFTYVSLNKESSLYAVIQNLKYQRVVRDAYIGLRIHESISFDKLLILTKRMEKMNYGYISPKKILEIKHKPATEPFFVDKALFAFSAQIDKAMVNITWALLPLFFIGFYILIFGFSRRVKPRPKKANNDLFFVFIVPALNEEKVIRKTIQKLVSLKQDNFTVLAMNDNSEDKTAEEIKSVNSDKLHLINLKPPGCRQGKGSVLNKAYRYVLDESGILDRYSEDKIVLGVIDSDGNVDPEILPSVAPYFDDQKAAAVQTTVRIENNDQNILTKWQEFEFAVFSYFFQSVKEQLGSVGLGGNGQFIRLSALKTLGEAPWTSCLTEDLDIGIRLILKDWDNHFCTTSFVYQQAIPKFWPLVKQRTRWFQGHVQCWRHLGRIAIKGLPVLAKADIAYYLLGISLVLFIIPANLLVAIQALYLLANPGLLKFISDIFGYKIFFYWYFAYYGAMPIFSFAYWRAKRQPLYKAVLLTHFYLLISLVWSIAGYIALFRMFSGRTAQWQKTSRYSMPQKRNK